MSAEFRRIGPQQVGRDDRHQGRVVERPADVVTGHNPGIVDDDVHIRMLRENVVRGLLDALRVGYIQLYGPHPRIGRRDHPQQCWPAPGDDDLVASLVQLRGEAAADAGGAASDENRVAAELHAPPFRRKTSC